MRYESFYNFLCYHNYLNMILYGIIKIDLKILLQYNKW